MKILKTVALASMVIAILAFNRISDLNKASYNAYLSGSMNLWKQSVEMAKQNHKQSPTAKTKYEWAFAEFGLLNATMKDQNEDIFDDYIDGTVEKLEELIDMEYNVAESKAVLSALTGLKIAYSPLKGMFLGPKSSSYITEALALDPQSPIVQQLYGNNQNFTPEMWGGNQENAIEAYNKAISIYEEQDTHDLWMYLDVQAWLGILHKKAGRDQEALEVWTKAIKQEPDFNWVKKNLIPSLKSTAN